MIIFASPYRDEREAPPTISCQTSARKENRSRRREERALQASCRDGFRASFAISTVYMQFFLIRGVPQHSTSLLRDRSPLRDAAGSSMIVPGFHVNTMAPPL